MKAKYHICLGNPLCLFYLLLLLLLFSLVSDSVTPWNAARLRQQVLSKYMPVGSQEVPSVRVVEH